MVKKVDDVILKYPFLSIAFVWLIGLYIGDIFNINHALYYFSAGLVLLIAMIYFFKPPAKTPVYLLLFSILFFSIARIGWYHSQHDSFFSKESVKDNNEVSVRGYISSVPIIDGGVVSFTVSPISYKYNDHISSPHLKEKILAYIYLKKKIEVEESEGWQRGMGVTLHGELKEPVSTRNPGLFNYRDYLEKQSIFWKISVSDISDISIAKGTKLETAFYNFRNYLSNQLHALFIEERDSGFINSILLGDRSNLDQNLKENFSILGLSHLIAISGLHLSVLTLLLFWFLNGFGFTRERIIYIVSVILILYMLLTGGSASVVRATTMTLIILYGVVLKKSFSALQALGFSLIIMTVYNPMWIYDIGFQLSFIITFFLVYGHNKIVQLLPIKHTYLRDLIAVTIITQIASFPLVFHYFHQYSLLSSISNLLFVPFFSILVLPLSFILIIISSLKLALAKYLANFISLLLEWLFNSIDHFSNFSFFHLYGSLSLSWTIFLYFTLLWLLNRRAFRLSPIAFSLKRSILIIEKIIIIGVFIVVFYRIISDNKGVMTTIDVGQGDSILLQTPNHYTILVDSGGTNTYFHEEWQKKNHSFDPGKDIILPFLHYKGIDHIDMAIVTHEDFDHMGGFLSLVDHIPFHSFIVNDQFPRTDAGKRLQEKLLEHQIRIVKLNKAMVLKEDDFKLDILPIYTNPTTIENNKMIVLSAKMYKTNILLTGDLEVLGERVLLDTYNLNEIDILKVGHHGASTSTSKQLLLKTKPKEAIISVGANNRYNHPSNSVIHSIVERKINIWRTDKNGAITINIYPNGYRIDDLIK